jgi:hypothetical protein
MQITHYTFGKITIDGKTYRSDVIITSNNVKDNWWRKEGHNLAIADLDNILDANPEVVIIGSGYYGRMQVPEVTREFLKEKGIQVEVVPTSDAVEKFNQLQQECARIVAVLHLTC